jgi:hypothetical protein
MTNLADPVTQVDGEVIGVVNGGGPVVVTFGHEYDRHTAILRRLNALHRVGVEVSDFAWLDPVTDPDERWLENVFALWEMGRHRDPTRMEPIDVARRRLGRLHGQIVLDRLLALVIAPGCEQRRRRTIAHAAVLTGFNTHTTEAGNALVAAGTEVDVFDGFTAMSLLDGARGIAELSRFGVPTDIAEAPLIPLIEHDDWHVRGAATQILAELAPPRSDLVVDALVRLAHQLVTGSKSTEIRAEQVVAALATAAEARTDVDDALDALRHHVTSAVRVGATTTLAQRLPDRARTLWDPWLSSRSMYERTAAESMITALGDERDVPEVARIVEHRIKPPKGTTYWPPLSAEGLDFLVRYAHVPEAAAALERVRNRWDRHDADLRRWLQLHHTDLIPPSAGES